MRLIDDDEAVADEVWQVALGDALGHHPGSTEPEAVGVILPHLGEVFRAEDEGFEHLVVAQDAGDGGCDAGFAEADDVADHDPACLLIFRQDIWTAFSCPRRPAIVRLLLPRWAMIGLKPSLR